LWTEVELGEALIGDDDGGVEDRETSFWTFSANEVISDVGSCLNSGGDVILHFCISILARSVDIDSIQVRTDEDSGVEHKTPAILTLSQNDLVSRSANKPLVHRPVIGLDKELV
jgi:hypothetical protein